MAERRRDPVRGLVAGDGGSVHAATRAQVVAREVNAADRPLEHGVPAVPTRGGERDAFRPALHLQAGHGILQLLAGLRLGSSTGGHALPPGRVVAPWAPGG